MKQDVNVSGHIDGIPSTIDHKHEVVIEVRISDQTTKNLKDIALTIIFAQASVTIAKSLVGTANRLLLDQQYAKLYPPVKW